MSEALTRADTYIEDLLSWIPSEGRGFVQGLLSPLTQVLYEVTGDPDDLMRAAQVWADSSAEVEGVGQAVDADASGVVASWQGEAADAFRDLMTQVSESIQELVDGVRGTADLLVEAANAAVEAFNLILQLIGEFLLWAGTTLILALAASIISFGASVGAWMATTAARIVMVIGRGSAIAARLAAFLMRIASVLRRIAQLLIRYRNWLRQLKQIKQNTTRLRYMTIKAIRTTPGRLVFNAVSPINIPGAVGLGSDVAGGVSDLQDGSVDGDYLVDSRGR